MIGAAQQLQLWVVTARNRTFRSDPRAYARGGGGLRLIPPWAWYFTKALLPAQSGLIVFAYFGLLICRLKMQIPRNEFTCKFQGILQMGEKVIVRFWWECGLLSASRNQLTTFCRPFVHYACLRLCSAIVHFIQNNCLILSAMAELRKLCQNVGL